MTVAEINSACTHGWHLFEIVGLGSGAALLLLLRLLLATTTRAAQIAGGIPITVDRNRIRFRDHGVVNVSMSSDIHSICSLRKLRKPQNPQVVPIS